MVRQLRWLEVGLALLSLAKSCAVGLRLEFAVVSYLDRSNPFAAARSVAGFAELASGPLRRGCRRAGLRERYDLGILAGVCTGRNRATGCRRKMNRTPGCLRRRSHLESAGSPLR